MAVLGRSQQRNVNGVQNQDGCGISEQQQYTRPENNYNNETIIAFNESGSL